MMAPIFFGVMVLRESEPDVAGLMAPSSTQPGEGRPVTTGMLSPLMPSGTCCVSCMTTDERAARSKIGCARRGGRNPLKSVVRDGALIAMGGVLLRVGQPR